MFEAIVTSLLNKFLGDFVQNLEGNQLNLGILNGNVVLTNLKLKKEALDKLNLPIDVIYGFLGRLVLQIPWTSIKTQPVTMLIEDLHLLASPRTEHVYDAEMEDERKWKSKISSLERIELLESTRQSFKDNPSLDLPAKDEEASFTNSLISKIIDNIQITIKNIHIKYEDSSNGDDAFDFGIILESFTAISANSDWLPTFLVNPGNAVNKLLKLRDLSIYFDSSSKNSLRSLTFEEFVLKSKLAINMESTHPSSKHQALLRPVCGEAKAIIRKKKIANRPQNEIDISFDNFCLSLDLVKQYQDILTLLAGMTMSTRALPFRDIRPPPPQSQGLGMFKFAIKCYLRNIKEKNVQRSWSNIFRRRDERLLYVKLYSNYILSTTSYSQSLPLSSIERRQLKDLETSLSLSDLVRYRNIAKKVSKKFIDSHSSSSSSNGNTTATATTSAMMWRFLGYKDKAPPPITDVDVQNLYDVIDFRHKKSSSSPPEDSPSSHIILDDTDELELKLSINECSFVVGAITSPSHEEMAMICSLHLLKTGITLLKRSNSVKMSLNLNDLILKDGGYANDAANAVNAVNASPNINNVIAPILLQRKEKSTNDLFTFSFDSRTSDHPATSADISLILKPLIFVLNLRTLYSLKMIMLSPMSLDKINFIKNDTLTTAMMTIKEKTRASLQKSLIEHRQSNVKIQISSPLILLPENVLKGDSSVFVVELGNLDIESVLVPQNDKEMILKNTSLLTEENMKKLHLLLYDRLKINLTKMRITFHRSFKEHLNFISPIFLDSSAINNSSLFFSPSSSINDGDGDDGGTVLDDVDLSILLDSCIVKGASNLAPLKIYSTLPQLSINICNEKIEKILSLLSNIPLQSSASEIEKPSSISKKDYKRKGYHDWEKRIEQNMDNQDDDDDDDDQDLHHSIPKEYINPIEMEAEFLLGKITVNFGKVENSLRKKVLSASIDKTMLKLSKRSFDQDISLLFGDLFLMVEGDRDVIRRVNTLSTDDTNHNPLLLLKIKLLQDGHCDFLTQFEGINRWIDLNISSICFSLSSKTIGSLNQYFMETLIGTINNFNTTKATDIDATATTATTATATATTTSTVTTTALQKSKITMNLDEFRVDLYDLKRKKPQIRLQLVQWGILLLTGSQEGQMRMSSSLKSLELLSLLYDDIKGERIIGFDPMDHASMKVELSMGKGATLLNSEFNGSLPLGSMIIKFDVASIIFVWNEEHLLPLCDIYSSLMLALESGSSANARRNTAKTAIKEDYHTQRNNGNPIDLDFRLESPIIIIKGSLPNHSMKISLGDLKIRGNISLRQDSLIQIFSLKMEDIFISQSFGYDECSSERWLLEPCSLSIGMEMMLEGDSSTIYSKNISCDVDPIRMKMNHCDYIHLIYLINHLSRSSALLLKHSTHNTANVNNSNKEILIEKGEKRTLEEGEEELLVSLRILFKEFHFTIENSENNDSMIDFCIGSSLLMMTSKTLEGMDLSFSIESLLIRDLEHSKDPFKDLIRIGGSLLFDEKDDDATIKNAFMLRMKKSSSLYGGVVINAELSTLHIFALWHSIYHLQYFFLSGLTLLENNDDNNSDNGTAPTPPEIATSTEGGEVPTPHRNSQTTIFFTANDMTLHLLDDYTSQRSNTLRIKMNSINLTYTITSPLISNLSMAISDISMALFNMDGLKSSLWSGQKVIESGGIILLDDCSISLRLLTNPNTLAQNLSLTLPSILLSISLQDILLVQKMISGLSIERERYSKIFTIKTLDPQRSVKVVVAAAAAPAAAPADVDSPSSTAVQQQKGIISLSSWRIVILDDSNSSLITPLVDFCLADLVVNISDWSTKMAMIVGANISSSCYNVRVGSWEPILEPFDFHLERDASSTILEGRKGLELLLSHDHLERITKFMSDFNSTKMEEVRKREVSPPYQFSNETLSTLIIGTDGDENVIKLATLQEQSSTFKSWTRSRLYLLGGDHSNTQKRREDLHPEEDDPTEKDSINRGDRVAWLKNLSKEDEKYYFEVDKEDIHRLNGLWIIIKLIDGVRRITIREDCLFKNETLYPIKIVDGMGKTLNVKPLGSCSISSLVDPFSIVPLIGDDDEYWPPKEGIKLLEMAPSDRCLIIKSSSKNASSLPHQSLLSLFSPSPLEHQSLVDLVIRAPLVIENLLPYPVSIQLAQTSLHRDLRKWPSLRKGVISLEGGESVKNHSINPFNDWEISSSIPSLGLRSTFPTIIKRIDFDTPDLMNYSLPSRKNSHHHHHNGQELSISLLLQSNVTSISSMKISLYLPYMIVNRSGSSIEIKEDGLDDPLIIESDTSIPFSFTRSKGKKIKIRIAPSTSWSKAFSIDAVGSNWSMEVEGEGEGGRSSSFSFKSETGSDRFALTRILKISAKYYLNNCLEYSLLFSDGMGNILDVPSKTIIPLHLPLGCDGDRVMIKAVQENSTTNWLWPFSISNPGKLHIPYNEAIIEVEKGMKDGTIVIAFSNTLIPPFIIRNKSSFTLLWKEDGIDGGVDGGIDGQNHPTSDFLLGVGEKIFCWKRPLESTGASSKGIIFSVKEAPLKEIRIDPLKIGEVFPFSIGYFDSSFHSLKFFITAEGPTIVVSVEDFDHENDVSITVDDGEIKNNNHHLIDDSTMITIKLPWINCSFIGPNLQEFLMIHCRSVFFQRQTSSLLQRDMLKIGWMQFDNQTYDWESPIILYPTVLKKTALEMENHPMVKISMMRKTDDPSYWKYVGILIQEFSLDIDVIFIRNLLAFSTFNRNGNGINSGKSFSSTPNTLITSPSNKMDWWKDMGGEGGGMSFYEEIVINPLKINITFTSRVEEENVSSITKEYQLNPLSTITDAILQSISNITDAPFSFNALILNNVFRNSGHLSSTIQEYYKGEALKQIHMVLGSLDLIGNPVLLLSTLGSGVTDLFWEPYQGLVSENPSDVGKGIARGSGKLFMKTVGGFSGFLSKISASIGRGLSVATLDKRYQRDRRIDRARNRPHHALHGLNNGIKQLYSGIWSGLSGIVEKPMEGVQVGGFEGFMVGCGKGFMGAIIKPLLGVIDLTTSVTEGVGSMSRWGDDCNLAFDEGGNGRLVQIRFPRPIPWDRRIRRYDYEGALGQSLYASISSPYHIQIEPFIAHLEIPQEKCVMILTVRNLILGDLENMSTIWTIPLVNIIDIDVKSESEDGLPSHSILLHLQNSLCNTKEIPSPSKVKSVWFSGCIIERLKKK